MSRRQHSPAATAAAAAASTSTSLRPRPRRLISIEGDEDGAVAETSSSSTLRGAVDSALSSSRRRSPAPAAHPSRATSATRSSPPQHRSAARTWGLDIPTQATTAHSRSHKSIWNTSWSSIHGVASTLLGSNLEQPLTPLTPGGGGGGSRRKSRHGRNYSLSVPDEPWGPSGVRPESLLAVGSQEERLAKVQAEKRKALLAGVGDEQRDALGKYKRRSSLDRTDLIPSPTEGDDALVYLHPVKPGDSVVGLSIKYHCPQAVVRKSNGLWPNDSIQLRKVAFLPVDACAVRGRKVASPSQSNTDLLADVGERGSGSGGTTTTTNGHNESADYHIATASTPSPDAAAGSASQLVATEDQNWTHDSWVMLSHSPAAVEIGRMPRRTLGFFPPARRKSITAYTDTSPARSITSEEAPPNATSSLIASARTSPGRGISPARRPPTRPARSSSAATRPNPHSRLGSSLFRGPGGVGSLHSSVHGPAPDELNRFVAQHMPQLMIRDAMESGIGERATAASDASMPRRAPMPSAGLGLSGPRLSFDRLSVASGSTAGTGVEAMAGAVEGWVRKVGGRVKGTIGTPEMRGRGARDGDLIELVEGWDINGATAPSAAGVADSWESEGHGVTDDGSPAAAAANGKKTTTTSRSRGTTSASAIASASAREDEERLLRERFPPAGKVFEEQSKKRA